MACGMRSIRGCSHEGGRRMVSEKLRVGVLGAGAWAMSAHIPGWQRDPRCEVATVCDVVGDRAKEAATRFDIPDAQRDWQVVVARKDLDVIDVVTPSVTHQELAVAALTAGKHVLCEKTLSFDLPHTLAPAELALRNRVFTQPWFPFPFTPRGLVAKA